MAKPRTLWPTLRAALAPAAGLIVVAFFGGYALFGPNGALAWGDYSRRLAIKQVELQQIEGRRDVLANRVAKLDPRHADPDLVDELARRDLGVVRRDEVLIRLK